MADGVVPKSDRHAPLGPPRQLASAGAIVAPRAGERELLAWGNVGGPNAGIVLYPPRATLGPRVQRDYELVLVHAGRAHVAVDRQTREIPAGHVGLLLPGRTELYAFAADRETVHSWMALPPHLIDADLRAALDRAAPCLPLSDDMHACSDLARDVATVDDPARRPVLVAVVRAALTLYVAEAAHATGTRDGGHPAVRRAREVVRWRAAEGMTVAALAREVGLSAEHLARLCRRDAGVTPSALLREERLRHAMHLLDHTGLSIAEVARRAGFASPQHFARLVRAATGASPTKLRQQRWSASDAKRSPGS